jgi:hypothetical protein
MSSSFPKSLQLNGSDFVHYKRSLTPFQKDSDPDPKGL